MNKRVKITKVFMMALLAISLASCDGTSVVPTPPAKVREVDLLRTVFINMNSLKSFHVVERSLIGTSGSHSVPTFTEADFDVLHGRTLYYTYQEGDRDNEAEIRCIGDKVYSDAIDPNFTMSKGRYVEGHMRIWNSFSLEQFTTEPYTVTTSSEKLGDMNVQHIKFHISDTISQGQTTEQGPNDYDFWVTDTSAPLLVQFAAVEVPAHETANLDYTVIRTNEAWTSFNEPLNIVPPPNFITPQPPHAPVAVPTP